MRIKLSGLLISVGALIMATQACAPRVSPEKDCHFVQNSLDQRVSWGHRVPVTLTMHDSVPVQYQEAIREAANWWNQKMGRQLIVISEGFVGGPIDPRQDGNSIIYFMDTWEDSADHNLEQARTSIYWRGEQIVEADVRFNNFKFGPYFSASQPVPFGKIDVTSLAIHEFGHVLGLVHIDEKGSVMNKFLATGENRVVASGAVEISSLSCEY